MVFEVVLIELNAVSGFGNTDAFISSMHCCKLFIAHLDGAETKAVIGDFFIMTAVCSARHKIRNNACFGIAFIEAFFEILEFFAVIVNAV